MPSLWCLLLLSPVCFLSHHDSLCCVPSDRLRNNRCLVNHWSILHGVISFTLAQTLLSCPQFPSLPTSFRVELLPIHVSFGCDTIWLVIGWWLCFSGVVRGPLSLDSSWYPQSSSQYILYTIYFKLSDLSFEWSSSLSDQDFFHFMCPYNTNLSVSNHYNPSRTYGKAS